MRRILYRSRTDRWIAGVCGGLGEYFGVDANAIRLGFVVLTLWQGVGLVLYLLMAIILPDEPIRELAVEPGLPVPPDDEAERRGRMLGAILVVGGAYLLARSSDLFTTLAAERGAGILLILAGLAVLLLRYRGRG
jgi:phage shock protein C